jgi:branched-chain amino acid transport system permease protein
MLSRFSNGDALSGRTPGSLRPKFFRLAGVALVVVLWIAGPFVLGPFSLRILSQAFLFAIVTITVDLLWGYAGVLTFGQSAFFGLGVYGVGLVLAYVAASTVGMVLGMAVGVGLAAIVAALVGWVAFWDGAPSVYPGVVTLALPIIFTQVILSGGTFTGSSSGLPVPAPAVSFEHWYWISAAVLGAAGLSGYALVRSDAGRVLVAIRENETRCRYLGIDVDRWKRWLMVGCGALAAAAGGLYVLFATVAAPQYSDFLFGTELVVWTALGGRGTLIGPLASAVVVNYVAAVLGGNLPFVWLLLVGSVFVATVVFLPQGLGPAVVRWLTSMRRRSLDVAEANEERGQEKGLQVLRVRPGSGNARGAGGSDGGPLIEVRELKKRYGSLEVLDGVSFKAWAGEIVGIVGPNGAGKTTLLRCIADGRERSSGAVYVKGRNTDGLRPSECVALGLGRKFQTPNVFEALTVLDCIRIARAYRVRPSVWRSSEEVEIPETVFRVLSQSGLVRFLDRPARWLPHGLKQVLELAMVLALEPDVVLLDEPTAGLTEEERRMIGELIADLANRGACILFIEHDIGFVQRICSRLIVLHMGRIVLDGTPEEVANSSVVREIYVGGSDAGRARQAM